MATNSVLLVTNLEDNTGNNNGIAGLTNSCVSIADTYEANNTSNTSALLVCLDEDATGTGSFGSATPSNQCTSCGVLQSNALTITAASNPAPSTICVGTSRTINASVSFLPFGMQYQWGTGTVGSNIISGVTTSSITVTPSATTTYWVRLVEVDNPSNASSSSSSTTITVNAPTVSATLSNTDMVWNGRISNNWNSQNNWLIFDNGVLTPSVALPNTSNNVIIPTASQTCVVNNANIPSGNRLARNLTIEANAALSMTGGSLRVDGDFTNNGTFTPGTNTVIFGGASNQNVTMDGSSNTFYDLTVNKTNGEVSLASNIQVTRNITMTARNLNLNNYNINLGTTGVIVNEGENRRIYCNCNDGYISSTATIGSNVTIEPGDMGLTLTTNGNQMGSTVIRRRHLQAGANGITGVGVTESLGIKRVFDVDPQFNGSNYGGNLNVDITIEFLNIEKQDLPNNQDISVYRSTNQGSTWDNVSFEAFTANSVTLEGLEGFSWVTAGPDDGNYLPIELISFAATPQAGTVVLNWSTATELNNDFFTIERSVDGFSWEDLLSISGAGTSIHRLDYSAKDVRPYAGLSYYRLKQTDFDGQFSRSNIVSVVVDEDDKKITSSSKYSGSNRGFEYERHGDFGFQ